MNDSMKKRDTTEFIKGNAPATPAEMNRGYTSPKKQQEGDFQKFPDQANPFNWPNGFER